MLAKMEMCNAGTRQRRQGALAVGAGLVEPDDEDIHFGCHLRGGWSLEVHLAVMKTAGNYLHWVGVRPITSDDFNAPFAAHQHLVPLEHRLVRQRHRECRRGYPSFSPRRV